MFDKKIYEKLAQYCAEKERCATDVMQKLRKLKAGANDFDEYLAKLRGQSFLNEERYIKAFVEAHNRKKWGKRKIESALAIKGVKGPLVKKYTGQIDEEDYVAQLKNLADKKYKSLTKGTPQEKRIKVMRFLLGKGFEMDKIRKVLTGE
ncbi:MAG TPA: regulatory protein RecX [Chitinophagales bacterium]|nr:regulatory protein RecX [Chitinophagales bacterium]